MKRGGGGGYRQVETDETFDISSIINKTVNGTLWRTHYVR